MSHSNLSLGDFNFASKHTNEIWPINLTKKPTQLNQEGNNFFPFSPSHFRLSPPISLHLHFSFFNTTKVMSFKLIVDGLLDLKSLCSFYENQSLSSPLQKPSINLIIKHQMEFRHFHVGRCHEERRRLRAVLVFLASIVSRILK